MYNYEMTNGMLEDVGVCCFSLNTGLFAAMKDVGNIQSVHCGHDHDNDYYGMYYNITLAYGRKTGYGAYGPPPGWLRGARIIDIYENPYQVDFNSIVQQDGTIVTQPQHQPGDNQQYLCCDAVAKRQRNFRSKSDPSFFGSFPL